jgi:hypothetical protein
MYLRILTAVSVGIAILYPLSCLAQSWEQYVNGVISCKDRVAVTAPCQGVSFVDLRSQVTRWRAIPGEIVDVRPNVAGNTAAAITHTFYTIYAFSIKTGKLLWQKENQSNILESDGKYFYVLGRDETVIEALNSASGRVVWSVRVPGPGGPLRSFQIHDNRLYTDLVVVDLSRKAIIHTWSQNSIANAMAFPKDGRLLRGDPFGVITVYNSSFERLRRMRLGTGWIVDLAAAGNDLLAAIYPQYNEGSFKLLTQDGSTKWHLDWRSNVRLDVKPFALAGQNVVLIEPGETAQLRLTSRKLSNGALNWTTGDGFFIGPPAVCGNTVYVSDGDRLRGFDLSSGAETTLLK